MPKAPPTCRIHEKYPEIECTNPILPGDPDGLCILHSQNPGKDPAAFREALLQIWNREDSKSHVFSAVFFPGIFDPKTFFGLREFNKAVTFYRAIFADTANFIRANFAGDVDFVNATFLKGADFSGANFKGKAFFNYSTFLQKADFRNASFMGKTDFSKATFAEMERAFFLEANFREEVDFSAAKFKENAIFQGANFNNVNFSWAKFDNDVSFYEGIFKKEASFLVVTFSKRAFFSWAVIEGLLIFHQLNLPQEGEPPSLVFQAEFRDLQFRTDGVLRFQDLSLAHAQFAGTDLRRPEFHHVSWHHYGGRQTIYDEILLRKEEKEYPWFWKWFRFSFCPWLAYYCPYARPPETPRGDRYGAVERLYRYLKINYEGEHDYKNAGDFHYGEMEMHRRASKWRWFPFYWYNLYWALSGYGERPDKALGWLAFFLAGFTGLLAWIGLDPVPPHQPAFGDAFFYLLQKATLQRPEWANPLSFWGKLVAGFSVFLIPGQAALFLLALRNRLGRRR